MSQPTEIILQSRITCPECGHESDERMPTDACMYYFECPACKMLLKPRPGDCCVFCSYGSVPCPPIQSDRHRGDAKSSGCCR